MSQAPGSDPDDGSGQGFLGDDSEVADGSILSLNWKKLYNVPRPLKEFAKAPVAFIVGTLLSYLLGGIEAVVVAFLEAIGAVANAFGVVPRTAADILTRAGGGLGDALLTAITGVLDTFQGAAASAGPLAPLFAGLAVAGSIVAAAFVARWLYNQFADALVPL